VGIAVAIAMTNLKDILGLDNYAALLGDSAEDLWSGWRCMDFC
jgi:hypothetical protein